MSESIKENIHTSVKFEEDFIFRNNRSVTTIPDVALTEFVANAWDAGAYSVFISIPKDDGDKIIVEDDGTGMSDEEFRQRWMTLNYDRQKRQGKDVIFPSQVEKYKRIAYGRNGIGRHGMLCFSNDYAVKTWQNGICNQYKLAASSGDEPFKITDHTSYKKEGHGTVIEAYVHRHLPNIDSMTDIISGRFLYDPKFSVKINNRTVDLLNHKGILIRKEIRLENNIKLLLTIIDSTKTALKSQQHGIAFWVSGRLVGKPSWTHGNCQFLDGRFKAAKRYTLIIQTDDLIDDILPDWSGFIDSVKINSVYRQLKEHVSEFILSVMTEQIDEMRLDVIEQTRDDLETLPTYGQREISTFIETITANNPVVSPDFLKNAVQTMVKIEQSKQGEQLLSQLSQMSLDDLDKLTDLLTSWDIDDIMAVLNEIDKRVVVIEAIQRIYDDINTDELHTLHPLVLNARWLFGSQFDSPMFVSNSTLTTVVKKLFKEGEYDLDNISNPRKRPDIVCLKQYSIKAVCTDRIDVVSGGIMKPDQILIVELKRGGFEIDSGEVSQAVNYVRQIRKSAALHSSATITAYVVGASIGDVDTHNKSDSGTVHVVTYGQLVETASGKLFRLREQLKEHYNSLDNESIVEKALKEPKQMKIK